MCGEPLMLSAEQRKVLRAIVRCRTAVLGGHLDVCERCGFERPSYNSCRDRHCPKCQALAQHRWLQARKERLLPIHHFHVVFTLPAQLRPLVMHNRRLLFEQLCRTASATLLELGRDPKRLGAKLGVTAVLHTWTRDLTFHPHLHCLVTGGGLDDEGRFARTRPDFLFPVRVLGKLFRGKFLDALGRLFDAGKLELRGRCEHLSDPASLRRFTDGLYRKDWVVYCKPPFGSADAVLRYLGRYTHRIGISNGRLLDVTADAVTFRTRHGKSTSLPPQKFLARLLTHVLPTGFVRIRHYGLLAPANVHTDLARARAALVASSSDRAPVGDASACTLVDEVDEDEADADEPPFIRLLRILTGVDLRRCLACRNRTLVRRPLPDPQPARSRGPP
jgi:hypothetical protein